MAAKQPIMVLVSDGMRDSIDKRCTELNIARAELIRRAVADYLGLDISKELKAGRPKKYPNKEAREEAQRTRNRLRRQATAKLIRAYESGEHEDDIKALVESLRNQLEL